MKLTMRTSWPPVLSSTVRTDTSQKTYAPQDSKDERHMDDNPDMERTPSIDRVAEKRLVRKLDLMIVPPIMLLYLLSFLDRVNIGNARLYGLEKDLGMAGNQYQTAVSLLFVTYILSELPSNLVIKRFKPSRWIAFITTSWGIIATSTGAVQSYAGLIVCRLLLGAVEGGLFPGCVIYLTLFYTKRELALRVGYLFVSAALAGGLGGLLGYAIGNLDGNAGLRAWRWIMIIEGLPTFVLGIAVWWWLADDPETAYYLTAEEKALVITRKKRQLGYSKSSDEMLREDVMKGLKDWKVYVICVGQFCMDTMLYGYSTFLPTIIKGLGHWNTAQTQALTIPCYALGAIIYLLVARLSDAHQERGLYVVICGTISVVGYGILISDVSSGVHYFATCLIAIGLYVCVGLPLAWLPANSPRYGKRTTASGLQLTIGNAGGIGAPFYYATRDAPRYVKGHAITLGLVAFATLLYGGLSLYFTKRNAGRREGREDYKMAGKSVEEIAELGDESPRFIFTK